jgi:hypothetical protein
VSAPARGLWRPPAEPTPEPRRIDPFRVLGSSERRRQLDGYREFLRGRDGELDFPGRRLSKREAWVAELGRDRLEWTGEVDFDGFYQHLHGVARPPLDARTIWLVSAAMANQMEAYGVELEIAKWLRRGWQREDEILLYDLLEEHYHTVILGEVCRTAGLGDVTMPRPNAVMRGLTAVMNHFPGRLRYVPVVCGEILGTVIFGMLREHAHLFGDEPEVAERIRSLIDEVITDETGHVLYCRAHMPPRHLRVARALIPTVSAFILRDVPQLVDLGLDAPELARRLREGIELPAAYDWLEDDPPS